MCPTEQPTQVQRDTAEIVFKLVGCSGPIQQAATPGSSSKYIVPAYTLAWISFDVVGWLASRSFSHRESPELTPESPPPRISPPVSSVDSDVL